MPPQRCHELTRDQWPQLLPSQRPVTERPANDHRTVLNCIVWVLQTGAPLRDLPERYGCWQTGYHRFRRWREAGVRDQILRAVQQAAAHADTLDGSLVMIDGSSIRAYQYAVGDKTGAPLRQQGAVAAAGGANSTASRSARASRSWRRAPPVMPRHDARSPGPAPARGLRRKGYRPYCPRPRPGPSPRTESESTGRLGTPSQRRAD